MTDIKRRIQVVKQRAAAAVSLLASIRSRRNVTYLLIELHKGWLELLLDILTTEMVRELVVGERHALGSFLGSSCQLSWVGDHVERCRLVLGVSDLVKMDMRNLLVLNQSWVVRRRVAWQLGEIL